MWDLVILNESNGYYTAMTPNGDVHCIDKETYLRFKEQGRIVINDKNID